MPVEIHAVEVVDGSNIQNKDRVVLAVLNGVTNVELAALPARR